MANWTNATITNKGYALQAKLLSTDALSITRVVSGSGRVTAGKLVNQTAVSNIQQTLTVESLSYDRNGNAIIKVSLNNTALSTSYVCNQIGIYANDPDEGEILYMIAQEATAGETIPSIAEQPNGYYCGWMFSLTFSNSQNISVTIDPANALTQDAGDARYTQTFIINCKKNSDGTYSADKTFDEINTAYKAGKNLYVDTTFGRHSLGLAVEDSSYTFNFIFLYNGYDAQLSSITISADNKVLCLSNVYSVWTDLTTGTTVTGSVAKNTALTSLGKDAFLTGFGVSAMGKCDFAEGYQTTAMGGYSHCQGYSAAVATAQISGLSDSTTNDTILNAWNALSENSKFSLARDKGHAEGHSCLALGTPSHAEGWETAATGNRSHSQGRATIASGTNSHSEGGYTEAKGTCSHASGGYTIANHFQFVAGKYNTEKTGASSADDQTTTNSIFIIGCGASSARKNAFRVSASGKCYGSEAFGGSGADYAEYFEWLDGNPDNEDRRGRFVTLDGEKIRLANADDDYILGVISAAPAIEGDTQSEDWHNKYLKDVFGQKLTETVEVEETTDDDGTVIPAHTETRYILNPEYNPEETYISREERNEWSAVGMLGKLVVVDDGTCQVNGYCKASENGTATAASSGYRVLKRIDDTHIRILVR